MPVNIPPTSHNKYISWYKSYQDFQKNLWYYTFFDDKKLQVERLEKMWIKIKGGVAIMPKNVHNVELDISYHTKPYTFLNIILHNLREQYRYYLSLQKNPTCSVTIEYFEKIKNSPSLHQAMETSDLKYIQSLFDQILTIYLLYLWYTIENEVNSSESIGTLQERVAANVVDMIEERE